MLRYIGIAGVFIAAFAWGLAAGTYKIFPYNQVKAVQDHLASFVNAETANTIYRGNPAATERGLAMADWGTRANIVMIGDSITELAPWKDMFPDADILNRGASGDTVGGVEERLAAILKSQPDHAFILIGTNDLNLSNNVENVLAIYDRVVARLQAANITIYAQSVPLCETEFDFCTDKRRGAELELNNGIERLASKHGAHFVNLAAKFPKGREFRADGVHPTVSGYKAWRDILAPAMAQLSDKEETE